MKKKTKVSLIVVSAVAVILTAVLLIYYLGASYPYYESISTAAFNIPGLDDGFTPQGMTYVAQNDDFLISGYMKNDDLPSRIYLVDADNDNTQKYITLDVDGTDFTGHCGGIAIHNDNVFVSSEGHIYRLSLAAINAAENGDKISVIDYFKALNGADCITVRGDDLWVNEFYRKGKYETPEVHHLTTVDGDENKSVAYCYRLDDASQYGVASLFPYKALSTPSQVQGIEYLSDGTIVVSTSYSIADSKILVYEDVFGQATEKTIMVETEEITLYELTSSKLIRTITAPAMTEELAVKNNEIYVLYESAARKYKYFNRTRIDKVHSLVIENEISEG